MYEQGSHRNSRLSLLDFSLHKMKQRKMLSYEFCTESSNLPTDNKLGLVMQARV